MSKEALKPGNRKIRNLALAIALIASVAGNHADAATYQTVNFSVTADRPEVAEQVGKAAELYRRQLAVFWLGKPLPNWSRPCKLSVREGALGAGGQTTFQFVRGEVLNWRMQVQGTLERILDSVLPHEINHTIFACHFRRPLPRWADEGAATLFEHRSEQLKQLALLNEVIRNRNELISLRDLLSMKEYPQGQRAMLTLYAQGYALADFLVQQKGRHAYLKFISDAERNGWEQAIRANFDHEGIESLERNWKGWVLAGMPKLTLPREQMLAAREDKRDSELLATARPEIQSMTSTATNKSSGQRRRQADSPQTPNRQPLFRAPSVVVRSQSPEASKPESPPALPPAEAVNAIPRNSELFEEVHSERRRVPRSGTITAPRPRRPDASEIREPQKAEERHHRASERQNARQDATDELFFEDYDAGHVDNEPEGTVSAGLERTTVVTQEHSRNGSGSLSPGRFDFGTPILPKERDARPGSTPEWAGFPGLQKSF